MEIERTTFGTITIDGKTYEHDVIIRLSGEVARRKKKLSKKYYGTSHILSKDEAKFIYEDGCEQLILGSGQMGNVHLSPEAGQSRHSDCAPMTSGLPRLADNLRAAEPVANLIAEARPLVRNRLFSSFQIHNSSLHGFSCADTLHAKSVKRN